MNTQQKLYGIPDSETVHETIEDAIDCIEKFPVELEIYRRMTVEVEVFAQRLADWALEHLDCDQELGDPDDSPKDPTDAQRALCREFAEKFAATYTPWACEPTGETITVDEDGNEVKP